jgi:hypothetical protein
MECISELKDSLNMYFGWNKARMTCFVNMLLALLATRTVNLNNSDPSGRKFLATNQDEKWKQNSIMFIY